MEIVGSTCNERRSAPLLRQTFPPQPPATPAMIDDTTAAFTFPAVAGNTCDVAHGHQQLSLFNAHYDERCFLPIHVYDTEKSRPVAVILRPGKTPSVKIAARVVETASRVRLAFAAACPE